MAVLPMNCRRYLNRRDIPFKEHVEGDRKAVLLKQFSLPISRFDAPSADCLILLPSSYPDIPPDMFFTFPWLRLAGSNRYPTRANVPFQFLERGWQRWSRHNSQWRPGIDGIWTMLKRIELALECAARRRR